MNRHPSRHTTGTPYRPSAYGAAIEWEELPSLAQRLITVETRHAAPFQNPAAIRHTWDVPLPAALDPLHESGPSLEPLRGRLPRELREPDVFRHFFA